MDLFLSAIMLHLFFGHFMSRHGHFVSLGVFHLLVVFFCFFIVGLYLCGVLVHPFVVVLCLFGEFLHLFSAIALSP